VELVGHGGCRSSVGMTWNIYDMKLSRDAEFMSSVGVSREPYDAGIRVVGTIL
jgi:hypothetical protein